MECRKRVVKFDLGESDDALYKKRSRLFSLSRGDLKLSDMMGARELFRTPHPPPPTLGQRFAYNIEPDLCDRSARIWAESAIASLAELEQKLSWDITPFELLLSWDGVLKLSCAKRRKFGDEVC